MTDTTPNPPRSSISLPVSLLSSSNLHDSIPSNLLAFPLFLPFLCFFSSLARASSHVSLVYKTDLSLHFPIHMQRSRVCSDACGWYTVHDQQHSFALSRLHSFLLSFFFLILLFTVCSFDFFSLQSCCCKFSAFLHPSPPLPLSHSSVFCLLNYSPYKPREFIESDYSVSWFVILSPFLLSFFLCHEAKGNNIKLRILNFGYRSS